MSKCNAELFEFPSFDRRKIEASFSEGDVSSDGGVMLLRAADRRLGLVRALDTVIADPRDPALTTHAQFDMLRQRIYGLALGYEDLNDRDTLRKDLAWQSAIERGEELASSPTLCRLENRADRRTAAAMSRVRPFRQAWIVERPPGLVAAARRDRGSSMSPRKDRALAMRRRKSAAWDTRRS